MKGNEVKLNSTARAGFALLRAFLLLALALACVPSVAYATEDMGGGFSGSDGGDFWQNLRQNFDFENTDWYIGSVWDSVFGGGGGHAFSGNTSDNTSDTSSASDTAPVLEDGYYYIDGGVYTGATVASVASDKNIAGICTTESKYQQLTSVLGEHTDWYYYMAIGGNANSNKSGVLMFTNKKPTLGYDDKPYGCVIPTEYNGSYPLWIYSINQFKQHNDKWYIDLHSVASFSYPSDNATIAGGDKNGLANSTWFYYYGRLDGKSYSLDGDSGTTDAPTEPSYPSDNPDYPTPTTYNEPDTTLPTIGDQTETTVDLSPVTDRQDITNTLLYGVGSDLGNMYNMVWTEFDQLEREVYDLGDLLTDYLRTDTALLAAIGYTLDDIHTALGNLDQDTDAIDLSGINSKLDDLIDAMESVTPYDDTNLITTIENAAYDDSALISAITGSHGSDVLGLFGRIDVILNWLDTYTGFDDTEVLALVENIYDALNNMQDEDTNVTTIRGDVRGIYNEISNGIMHQLGDLTESDGEVLTVRGLLHWIHYYISDIDRVLNDWPDYPLPTDISLTAIEGYLSDTLDEMRNYASDFVSYWGNIITKLDEAIDAIEALDFGTNWPSGGAPDRPTPNQLVQYVNWVEWDNAVETLMHKFPFVIVNDITLIFAALTRPAITPVFDLPMPNPSDWSTPYLVHVDLSDWDTVAAVMRVGIMLWVISRVSRRTLALFTRDEGAAA